MGYIPDARLGELMVHLKKRNQRWDRPVIACVGDLSLPFIKKGKSFDNDRGYLAGAARQAEAMGYQLEAFPLKQPGLTHQRLSDMLYSRGISGLFIGAMEDPSMRLELDWSRFTSVALGHSLAWPILHRVSNHQLHSMRTCYQNTRALGYQRIGFLLLPRIDARTDYNLKASFLTEQSHEPSHERVPLLLIDEDDEEKFRWWYTRYKPDVIIYAGTDLNIFTWLENMKLEAPRDLGLVNAGLHNTSGPVTGMHHNMDQVGAAAIDLLISEMQKNAKGIPASPKTVLLEGTWVEGTTAIRSRPAPSATALPVG